MDYSKGFRCSSRDQNTLADRQFPGPDIWRVEPNGDRTCSFCGSLCEEDFIDICKHYADGDAGYRFDPTTKPYKRYASRPGVKNASEGGIKFYNWHVDRDSPTFKESEATYQRAFDRFEQYFKTLTETAGHA